MKGTIVDSTLVGVPSSAKNRKKERAPDTHQANKGNQWYFGYKGHIGVDRDTGLVNRVETTAAKYTIQRRYRTCLRGRKKCSETVDILESNNMLRYQ